jgi:hypothetical protein
MPFILHENLNKFNLFTGGRFDISPFNNFSLFKFYNDTDNSIQGNSNNRFKPSELDKTIFCVISLAYYHTNNNLHTFIICAKYNKNLSTVVSISNSTINLDLVMIKPFTYKIEVSESSQFSFDINVDVLNETSFSKRFNSI